jgi:hypothetical protein
LRRESRCYLDLLMTTAKNDVFWDVMPCKLVDSPMFLRRVLCALEDGGIALQVGKFQPNYTWLQLGRLHYSSVLISFSLPIFALWYCEQSELNKL